MNVIIVIQCIVYGTNGSLIIMHRNSNASCWRNRESRSQHRAVTMMRTVIMVVMTMMMIADRQQS